MQVKSSIGEGLDRQRGQLFCWVPVFLGIGIGFYFCLPYEPPLWASAFIFVLSVFLIVQLFGGKTTKGILLTGLALISMGGSLTALRTAVVEKPVLTFRYYGPIEGRVISVDRSLSDKVRLTLDRVVLFDVPKGRTPARVRVALHSKYDVPVPKVGARAMLSGHLSPPQGPVEPGGFDFQRRAWFQKLGAVGYTRSPTLVAAPPKPWDPSVLLAKLRFRISDFVRTAIPGDRGGFAAAVLTGDRSGIGKETLADLRASNLAHLLAISGLHMGLLTGFVFAFTRVGLALISYCALNWPTKKIAAVIALLAGGFYLLLSGGAVATERAYIMAATMLLAVLMDRRALTLRAVALAATIVLLLRPETLIEPGFQMSFAATTALVVIFRAIRDWESKNIPKWLRAPSGLLMSSFIAGAATAPIGAAHFNMVAHYGLLANFLALPLMGTLVIPCAVLAAVLSPFGLAPIALAAMSLGVGWILKVAGFVSSLDGATSQIPAPHWAVLPVIALGALHLILWQGRGRVVGVVVACAGMALWTMSERPQLLVSGTGGLIGVKTEAGRVLSKPRGDGFVALSWLENDGDASDQQMAAMRSGFSGSKTFRSIEVDGVKIAHLTGKSAAENIDDACLWADLVVTNVRLQKGGCNLWDPRALDRTGALAITITNGTLSSVSARKTAGKRPWNRAQ